MIVFPNAKINLGLKIRSRRGDGFHNIETIFLPVGLKDILEIVPSKRKNNALKVTGLVVDVPVEKNLTYMAAAMMQNEYDLPGVNIHLHKAIPMGAGLGGGSADASFTISVMNRIFELNLSKEQMKAHAATLGSDCPFFIENTPMLGEGKGGDLSAIDLPGMKNLKTVIVKPDIHVSTAEAYSGVTPDSESPSFRAFLSLEPQKWREVFINDFEANLLVKHPPIKNIKDELYGLGAIYASMSGSGSALFGFFRDVPGDIESLFPRCFVWHE